MAAGVLLVATDFSDDALCAGERAVALSALLAAPVELVHVVSDSWLDVLGLRRGVRDTVERVRAEAAVALARQAESMRRDAQRAGLRNGGGGGDGHGHGVADGDRLTEVAVSLLEGAVVETAARRAMNAALLIVGAHGERPFRDAALGSTGERLVRRSRGPVLVARRETRLRSDREPGPGAGPWLQVLVGIDFSPYAAPALQWAGRLAAGAPIEVLHAFEAPFESKLRLAGVGQEEITRLRAGARATALERLQALVRASGLPEAQVRVSVVHGYAPHRIVDRARELGAGLLVIGKHGEARLEDLLLGSVALHVLAQAGCDVLVVQTPAAGDSNATPPQAASPDVSS